MFRKRDTETEKAFDLSPTALVLDASLSLEAISAIDNGNTAEAREALAQLLGTQILRIRVAQEEGLDPDLRKGTFEDLDLLAGIVKGTA